MMSSIIYNLPSVPTNNSEIQNQARNILDAIAFTPFEQCQPLSRDFSDIPDRPGIYLAFMQLDIDRVCFTLVKPKACEVVLKVDIKLFCGLGSINIKVKM
jgi:hypothetical protein